MKRVIEGTSQTVNAVFSQNSCFSYVTEFKGEISLRFNSNGFGAGFTWFEAPAIQSGWVAGWLSWKS
jgi:hypothetical protein